MQVPWHHMDIPVIPSTAATLRFTINSQTIVGTEIIADGSLFKQVKPDSK